MRALSDASSNRDVTLKNLALRSDLLRRLGLRVAVRKAIVDRLRIVVPWTDLRNKPLRIVLEGVHLRFVADLNPRAERRTSSTDRTSKAEPPAPRHQKVRPLRRGRKLCQTSLDQRWEKKSVL
eukprot:scaffold2534_cov260-Pinguiococcus_pyrenoidosus.AAC.19